MANPQFETEETVCRVSLLMLYDSHQGVIVHLGGLAWGQQLLTVKRSLLQN
jgi:hypothetical protein